jgi:hypothetical protein
VLPTKSTFASPSPEASQEKKVCGAAVNFHISLDPSQTSQIFSTVRKALIDVVGRKVGVVEVLVSHVKEFAKCVEKVFLICFFKLLRAYAPVTVKVKI